MAVNLLSPRIIQGFRNQRDNLTVGDADLIVADLEALNNAGGGGGVTSVSGDIVDNTVPTTPVINIKRDQTLSDVQANNGTYTAGSWVQVTEPIGSITGSANTIFPVIEGGFLAGTGWCQTFENSGMAATRMVKIDWDVTADFVSCIYEPIKGNRVTAHYSSVGLENFPFDTTTMFGVTLIDPNVCAIDVAAIVSGATFEEYGTITLGAGTTFRGTAGQEATVTLSDTATFIGSVGANGGVTLFGTQALNWYKIFPSVNVDLKVNIRNDYSATGGFVSQTDSTLVFRQSDLDGSSELNMASNGGIMAITDFKCAGTLVVTSNGTQTLNTITNFTAGRKYKIISDITTSALDLTVSPFVVSSGNIYLETAFNLVLKGSASPVDYLELQSDLDDAAKLVQVGGANYVI